MTYLDSKEDRDAIGIDSFERGFIYAALLLRHNITLDLEPNASQKNLYSDNVKIGIINRNVNPLTNEYYNDELAVIAVKAQIPYERQQSLTSGGNFIQRLKSLSKQSYSLYPSVGTLQPSGLTEFTMPDDPNWVGSLETYFAWTATQILWHYYDLGLWKNTFLSNLLSMKINLVDDNALEGFIQIDATIPMYYLLYLQSCNLLASVHSIIGRNLE